MGQDIITQQPTSMNFDEISHRRRELEHKIAQQESRLATVMHSFFSTQNIATGIASFTTRNPLVKQSIFKTISNGWQWIVLAMRLIRRYM